MNMGQAKKAIYELSLLHELATCRLDEKDESSIPAAQFALKEMDGRLADLLTHFGDFERKSPGASDETI